MWLGLRICGVAIVLATIFGAGAALAKKPREFQAPPEMTPEQIEAAKRRTRTPLLRYGKATEEPPAPFPWGFVGFAAASLLAAFPFALRAYRNAAREISQTNSSGRERQAEERQLDG